MNLQETVRALEQNNIQVALDIGVHQYCAIDSNCPLAVELRKIIHESEITLEQLIEGLTTSEEEQPDPPTLELPEISGAVSLEIGGQRVNLDFTDSIRGQLNMIFHRKVEAFRTSEGQLRELGQSFFRTSLHNIAEAKRSRTIPQLSLPVADLTKYGCLLTTDGTNYLFMFPIEYKPQWIYTRSVRHKMANEDIAMIERDIYVVFPVSLEHKILQVYLIVPGGTKFQHYHGRMGDCWGRVKMPDKWDGAVESLGRLAYQLQASLATINKDSLMQSHPSGMPDIEDVFHRSIRLGEEGVREEPIEEQGAPTPRRWGNGR